MDLSFIAHGAGWTELAPTITRVGTGVFFAISGYHKLFNAERHARFTSTLVADRVPFVKFNQWWVPAWEFVAGTALAVGFLTAASAAILMVICLVACACEACAKVEEYKPIDLADWLDDWLYLPEVLYVLLLSVNMLAGAGAYSVDAVLFPKTEARALEAVPVEMPSIPAQKPKVQT